MFETEDQQVPQVDQESKTCSEQPIQNESGYERKSFLTREPQVCNEVHDCEREPQILSAGISDCEAPSGPSGRSKVRDIRIKEVNRGFIVEVGCHTFAISTADELAEKVSAYILDPNGVESQWYKGDLF